MKINRGEVLKVCLSIFFEHGFKLSPQITKATSIGGFSDIWHVQADNVKFFSIPVSGEFIALQHSKGSMIPRAWQ
ncbi:MAG: hypothetical protein ACE5JB_16605 [bacterium]